MWKEQGERSQDKFQEIRQRVLKAIHDAPDSELIRELSLDKNNKEKIEEILAKSSVSVESLYDYRLVLNALELPKEEIDDILSHENAHANKAEVVGAKHLDYGITIMKNNKGGYTYQPYSSLYIPKEWEEGKVRDAWEKIATAPEEYKNKMSKEDIQMLQE